MAAEAGSAGPADLPVPRTATYRQALAEALREEMGRDPRVVLVGEDLSAGGAFGVTRDLVASFGRERVVDTPICENSFLGLAVGAAMTGLRPVVEIMFMDFLTLAMDQLVNSAAKIHYMYAGQFCVPMVVRTPAGGGRGYGPSHSQSLESWLIQVPGLKVVAPSDPADAKGLLKSAIRDPNPVVFVENKLLYPREGVVPEEEALVPLGQARLRRVGNDLSIIAYGRMLDLALEAAAVLAEEGVACDVLDLRTLKPLDEPALAASAAKTGRVVVLEEGTGGVAAEVCCRLLDRRATPVPRSLLRVAARDVPIPSASPLEDRILPSLADVVEACLDALSTP